MTNETNFEHNTEQDIKAMYDSVSLIYSLVDAGVHSDEIHDTITRNTSHLQLMLKKDHIKNSSHNLLPFSSAVEAGNDFLAE